MTPCAGSPELLGMTIAEALAAAGAVEPQPLLFLPHLAGERAPLWNADARAVFLGMTSHTTAGHLVRAVLEGVAHAARHLRESCEAGGRLTAPRRCACPAAAPAASCGTRSGPTPIAALLEQVASTMTGCLGAALMGGVAAGARQRPRVVGRRRRHSRSSVHPERSRRRPTRPAPRGLPRDVPLSRATLRRVGRGAVVIRVDI